MSNATTLSYSLLPYGPLAWLIQLECEQDIATLHALRSASFHHIQECVVGYDSLLILTSEDRSIEQVDAEIQGALLNLSKTNKPSLHHIIEVRYDGPDLDEVAELTKLSRDEVVHHHSSSHYSVRFLGFSAGFTYLDGLQQRLILPRRATPRPRMTPGAVAIGGKHAGIYATPSPGGWNWLGNTQHPLFNPEKNDHSAFTLHPGDSLEFRPI